VSPADLADPVFTIQHVAALLHVSVDTAREYTYRDDFPAAAWLGARLLWDREEVLAWFRGLPRQAAADRKRKPAAGAGTQPR
jgi:predicted DNA-binding transcriptional regulator AlpA